MEVLHVAPYKVLHLEYNEVKVLARLQKAIGESHTTDVQEIHTFICSQSGTEFTNTSLPAICHSISVRVSAP